MSPPNDYVTRIALVFGSTVLSETMVAGRRKITLGQAHSSTFVLASFGREVRRGRQVLHDRKGLHLLDGLEGRLHLREGVLTADQLRDAGRTTVALAPEDWAVLHLRDEPAVRLLIQRIRSEPLPAMSRERERPLWMTTGLSLVAFLMLLGAAFLGYTPGDIQPEVNERMARVMFNRPPDPPPEEEPQVSSKDQEEEKARKKAGGDEGKFGDPKKRGPSNVPRNPNESLSERVNVGLVRELNTLETNPAMADLLGVSGQVSTALGGMDDGALVIGGGNYGMSTKGGGAGGGGEGEGTIYGTGDLDLGGAGAQTRKKSVKGTTRPQEKTVTVQTGTPTVKGQLSKELIDREVRRHRSQLKFCYDKQLLRYPDLSGKIVLRWIIAMDGSVKSAKVATSSLGNRDAESCMVRALEGWKFPKPEGGVVQVDYPFLFGAK